MVRGRRLVALWAVGVTMAAALPGWSITTATPATAAAYPGLAWGFNGNGRLGVSPIATSPVLVSDGQRSPSDAFLQVSVGLTNACAVTMSGKAYCWGSGSAGALGNGSRSMSATPVLVVQGARLSSDIFTSVSVGSDFACGLTDRGAAFCWGNNWDGQLGSGDTTNSDSPVAVAGSLAFRSIDVGHVNGCGVAMDDSVYCWGKNSAGQLGNGTLNPGSVTSPTRVSGGAIPAGTRMASVAVGGRNACAVSIAGTAYCWGENLRGQLGNGATGGISAPVAVSGSLAYVSVTVGDQATCGIATDDSVYCWGSNSSGQLGTGDLTQQTTPTQVVTNGVLSGQAAASVSLYAQTTCVQTQSGQAACWGANSNGQVGDGTQTNATSPTAVLTGSKPLGTNWSQVSAGTNVTCGVAGGDAYCWGTRDYGNLGDGTSTQVPAPVGISRGQLPSTATFSSIEGGEASSCGVATDDSVYCWGSGANGRLGNGGTTTYYTPQLISGVSVPSGTRFAAVSVSREFGCARSIVGGVYCWGSNGSGQLGNGTLNQSLIPIGVVDGQKPADDTWTAIATGLESACGIASDDTAYCWGLNNSGQVGNGTGTISFTSPQRLAIPGPWRSITVGETHACAIAGDDSAYCWGNNSEGQLGIDSYISQNQPTRVVTTNLLAGETFTSLAAGSVTTCGLTSTGRILCWGNGNAGALGDGTGNHSKIPVVTAPPTGASGGVTYSSVTVGTRFACGLVATGVAYCWGSNATGQLGDGTFTARNVPTAVQGTGSTPFTSLSAGASSVLATFTPGAPGAPVLTSASTTQTSATITFTPGGDGGATIDNYQYSLDGGGWVTPVPADSASPITIPGLTAGRTYDVQLRAVTDVAPGPASNTLTVTTQSAPTPTPTPAPPAPVSPPGVPTGLTAEPGDRSVTVSWSAPTEVGRPPASGYQVESTDPGASCTTSATSCVVAGLVNGREYSFRVRAVNDSAVGAWSAWTARVTPVGVPSAPTSVVAVAGDDTAHVSWQAPGDDGGSPILNYTVRATPGTASCTVMSLTCEVSGLTNGVTYTFTVVATNAAGTSTTSAPSNAVTPERRVEPSILITGSRSPRASGDRVTIIGVTTGLVGSEAQAWVKASGRKDFSRRGEPVVISETERFRWTGTIRRAAQVYFASGDVRSNKITLPRR